MGDERTRGDASGGRGRLRRRRPAAGPPAGDAPASDPLTVEQLIARQGGTVGRRRAARTGDIPLPLAPGEPVPEHRRGLPPVPGGSGTGPDDSAAPPRGGLPPVPGAARSSGKPEPESAAPPADRPPRGGLPPVPPPPGRAPAPLPPLPGSRGPGRRSRRGAAPLPPIPGRDVPAGDAAGGQRTRRAARRAARSPARRRLVRVAVALGALAGLVLGYHLGLYFYVDRSIERVDALTPTGLEVLAPRLQEGDVTYLVVGTGLPGRQGPAAVTPLLAHVPAGGGRAVLVSIPPTALVDTPACVGSDGELREPASEAFATALLDGGPSCLVRAVQQVSGLRVDHYLAVDLARLPVMVDALGGVAVCLPTPSPAGDASAAPLPAGTSELSGEEAVAYLTPGDAAADVTGAAVAERVQLLLTSTLRAALSLGTLGDPGTLTRFLTGAADALAVDEGTTLGDLRTLAVRLGEIPADAVQRTGLPVTQVGYVPAGTEQAHVLLDGTATRTLFEAVIDGGRLPEGIAGEAPAGDPAAPAPEEPAPTADATAAAAPPAPDPLTVAPGAVTVDVLNGTGTTGLAATVADLMRAQGFGVGQVGNEQGTVNQTVVRYAPGAAEQARTVAAAVPGSVLQESGTTGTAVQLVLGPGYSTVVPVQVGEPVPAAGAAAAPATEPASEAGPVSCE